MDYPPAPRQDVHDELHGHRVHDPYRWLEDPGSPESQGWSEAQDDLCRRHLDSLPGRERLGERLRELLPGVIGPPGFAGGRAFFMRREPDQEHAVLVVREPDGTERVLIDPSALSDDNTITLDAWSPSKEGTLLAYQLSQGGDEESSLRVMRVDDGEIIDGPIDRVRYSSVAWLPGGETFFYARRLPPDEVPKGEEQFHRRVYRHTIGTDASNDEIVFGHDGEKTAYYGFLTSLDGRWLSVSVSLGTAPRNDLYMADLHGDGSFVTLQKDVDAQTSSWVAFDGRMYVYTDRDASRGKLLVADPERPQPEHWRELLPESDAVLSGIVITDDHIVATRTRHAISEMTVHDKDSGESVSQVTLPGPGSAGATGRPDGGNEVWIGYTDHVTPYRVLHYDIGSGSLQPYADPPG
ncbi:MAG TPA: S9 family peptidase, partial [Actinomycetota bacterium]|nr:S9 family peptidase [Actinomycetota bacterium]